VVLGAQWGDEGKGKLVDILAQDYDIVARFNGGANAGHTIVAQGKKFAFHMLPCGLLYPQTLNVVGNGVVVDFPALFTELKELQQANVDTTGRLFVSDRAHIVLQAHLKADGALEDSRGAEKIGTTRRGIGPTYTSKAMRNGVRVGDLLHWNSFVAKYNSLNDLIEHTYGFKIDRVAELGYFESMLPRIR
jgi:adenylosuccinate synthase